ncbi:hypothetical protein OAB00_02235 [Akkermansiaceae bacterium]|nr:hypothetical protein [Akkermansiaceae bacterium]
MIKLKAEQIPNALIADFTQLSSKVRELIQEESFGNARSIAIFAREGNKPFCEIITLNDEVKTQIILDLDPHLYPLVEANDKLDRYVIITLTRESAHIYETSAGDIINEISSENSDLRERTGREWTKEHYRSHRKDRNDRFVHQKLEIVSQLMNQKGYKHLLVAGSPKMISRFLNRLPSSLANKVINTITMNPAIGKNQILSAAIDRFIEVEKSESSQRLEILKSELACNGLAVKGYYHSLEAITHGYADTLIISEHFTPKFKREKLLREALRAGIQIETIQNSDSLKDLSGIGCLLRYKPNSIIHSNLSNSA